MSQRPYHRPAVPGDRFFEGIEAEHDPVLIAQAADRAAVLLVRGAREGIEEIAAAWAQRPADTVAGCLWRLYLLRSSVYADPVAVAREFEAGRARAVVDGVVAGVADPPGPDELRAMAGAS